MTILSTLYIDKQHDVTANADRIVQQQTERLRKLQLDQIRMKAQAEQQIADFTARQSEVSGQVDEQQQGIRQMIDESPLKKVTSSPIATEDPDEVFRKQMSARLDDDLDSNRFADFSEYDVEQFPRGLHARLEAHNRNIHYDDVVSGNNRFTTEVQQKVSEHRQESERAVKQEFKDTLGMTDKQAEALYDRWYGRAEKTWLSRQISDTGRYYQEQFKDGVWRGLGRLGLDTVGAAIAPFEAISSGLISLGITPAAEYQRMKDAGKELSVESVVDIIASAPKEALFAFGRALNQEESIDPKILKDFARSVTDDEEAQETVMKVAPYIDPMWMYMLGIKPMQAAIKTGAYGMPSFASTGAMLKDIAGFKMDPAAFAPQHLMGLAHQAAVRRVAGYTAADIAHLADDGVQLGPVDTPIPFLDRVPADAYDPKVAAPTDWESRLDQEMTRIVDDIRNMNFSRFDVRQVGTETVQQIKNNPNATEAEKELARKMEKEIKLQGEKAQDNSGKLGSPTSAEDVAETPPFQPQPESQPLVQASDKITISEEGVPVPKEGPAEPYVPTNNNMPQSVRLTEKMSVEDMTHEAQRIRSESEKTPVIDVPAPGVVDAKGNPITVKGISNEAWDELAEAFIHPTVYGRRVPTSEMTKAEYEGYSKAVFTYINNMYPYKEFGDFGTQQRAELLSELHALYTTVKRDLLHSKGGPMEKPMTEYMIWTKDYIRGTDDYQRHVVTSATVRRNQGLKNTNKSFKSRPARMGENAPPPPRAGNRPPPHSDADTPKPRDDSTIVPPDAPLSKLTPEQRVQREADKAAGGVTITTKAGSTSMDVQGRPAGKPAETVTEGRSVSPKTSEQLTDDQISVDFGFPESEGGGERGYWSPNRGAQVEADDPALFASDGEVREPGMTIIDPVDQAMSELADEASFAAAHKVTHLEEVTGHRVDEEIITYGTPNPFHLMDADMLRNDVNRFNEVAAMEDEVRAARTMAQNQQKLNQRLAAAVLEDGGDQRTVSLLAKGLVTERALFELASDERAISDATAALLERFNFHRYAEGPTEHEALMRGIDGVINDMGPVVNMTRQKQVVHDTKLAKQYTSLSSRDAQSQFAKAYVEGMMDARVIEKRSNYNRFLKQLREMIPECNV